MICSAVCLVRFMVESPAQSGRLRTLIHPGPNSRVHVMVTEHFEGRLPSLIYRKIRRATLVSNHWESPLTEHLIGAGFTSLTQAAVTKWATVVWALPEIRCRAGLIVRRSTMSEVRHGRALPR